MAKYLRFYRFYKQMFYIRVVFRKCNINYSYYIEMSVAKIQKVITILLNGNRYFMNKKSFKEYQYEYNEHV